MLIIIVILFFFANSVYIFTVQVLLVFHTNSPFSTDVRWPVRVPVVYKIVKVIKLKCIIYALFEFFLLYCLTAIIDSTVAATSCVNERL